MTQIPRGTASDLLRDLDNRDLFRSIRTLDQFEPWCVAFSAEMANPRWQGELAVYVPPEEIRDDIIAMAVEWSTSTRPGGARDMLRQLHDPHYHPVSDDRDRYTLWWAIVGAYT